MTNFVGAEYVIAVMLIWKAGASVSISELSRYRVYIQRMANSQKLDTVFLMSKSQVFNALHNFSDYFSYKSDSKGNLSQICLNSSKDVSNLEYRFIGYIPQKILDILSKCFALVIQS